MKTFQFKPVNKLSLFFTALLALGLLCAKANAQLAPIQPAANTDSMASTAGPNNLAHDQKPDPDTLHVKGQSRLTAGQLRKIVGADKPIGKDSIGREIYQDVNSKQYYVNSKGVKIYKPYF